MAGRDPLTGVANRRTFSDALARELARHARTGQGVAVILLDLDGLKWINDTHGHAAGDAAIVSVARACEALLRTTDLVARLGGDEFVVLLSDVDEGGARVVARRVQAGIEKAVVAGSELRVSVGIAVAEAHGAKSEDLLAEADRQLYVDKRGRKSITSQAA
jgi:diguanylate cyclase (GGDEF)-like protein